MRIKNWTYPLTIVPRNSVLLVLLKYFRGTKISGAIFRPKSYSSLAFFTLARPPRTHFPAFHRVCRLDYRRPSVQMLRGQTILISGLVGWTQCLAHFLLITVYLRDRRCDGSCSVCARIGAQRKSCCTRCLCCSRGGFSVSTGGARFFSFACRAGEGPASCDWCVLFQAQRRRLTKQSIKKQEVPICL